MSQHKRLFIKASVILSIAVILSRILGMVREQYTLYLFGAGLELDAFISASKIPNALRNLLGEGAFSAVFISIFSAIASCRSEEEANIFARKVISFLLVFSLLITGVGIITAPFYLTLIHKNIVNFSLVVELTYYIMPFLPFISLAAILMGMLNSWQIYFVPGIAPFFGNVVFIAALFFLNHSYGIFAMGIAFLLSSIVDFLVQIPAIIKKKFRFYFDFKRDESLHLFFKSFLPVAFGMAVFQINRIVSNIFSSSIEGGNTVFEKAFVIAQLILSVFITGISTVALPLIAQQEKKKAYQIYIDSLRSVFLIIFPFAIFFLIFSYEISSFIYKDLLLFFGVGVGKISEKTLSQIALILFYLSPGVLFFGLITLVNRGFQGLKLFYYPLTGSAVSVLSNYVLMSYLTPLLGIKAIPISISISAGINFMILFVLFAHRNKECKNFPLLYTVAKGVIAGSSMFFLLFFLKNFISLQNIIKLPFLCLLGLFFYVFVLFLLREEEIWFLYYALKKKVKLHLKKQPQAKDSID